MEQGQRFSHLVYEYFLLRLRFGYYNYGALLPPIETFSREFCVSGQTVNAALSRLRDEGYIEMRRGSRTRVVFCQTSQEIQNFIAGYCSERWDAITDMYDSAGLIFAPLLAEGLRRMSAVELDGLSGLSERACEDELFHFFCIALQKIGNPLAMNFFWETYMFLGFPLAMREHRPTQYDDDTIRQRMNTLISGARQKRWDDAQACLERFRSEDLRRITANLEHRITPIPVDQQLHFSWRIYRDRPQICFNLASRILHDIYLGEYRDSSYLPAYATMAVNYGVSVNTIRRTIGILNRLGAVESINGIGTLVFSTGKRCNPPDFSDPIIRRCLAFFVQSFDLVRYTCRQVTRAFLADLSPQEREELISQLDQNLRCGQCDVSLWHIMLHIAKRSRQKVVRELYYKLYGFFLWGYPLKASKCETPEVDQSMVTFTESMLRCLKANDWESSAELIKTLVEEKFPAAENYLLLNGIKPGELRLSRSMSFPPSERYGVN